VVDYRRSGGAAEWHGRARGKSTPPRLFYLSPRCKSTRKKLSGTSPAVFRAIALHSRSVRYARWFATCCSGWGRKMLPKLRPTARRLLSSAPAQLSMTSGAMYNWRVRAVEKALDRVGKAVGPLEVSDLSSLGHLDQYHYLGTEACDEVAELLGLGPGSTLLDIGSGIGGPARYLAATTGCSVVGVELQRDLYEASASLTSRCRSINKLVSFVNADATGVHSLQLPQPFGLHGQFDHFMSLLVNLHIPDRRALHAGILPRIRPGGTFVIDDFAAVAPATAAEGRTLVDLVKAPSVTSVSAYVAELEDVGFVDVETVDMTAKWAHWTAARHTEYVAAEAEMVALHGRQIFENRSYFYSKIDELFAGGRVGGVRITGRRPGKAEAALIAGRKSRANKPTPQPVHLLENLATYCGASAPATPQAVPPPQVSLGAQPAVEAQTKRVVATQASAAEQLIGAASAQPPLPWLSPPQPGLHDSLQYHFFLGPLFIAVRVFHTATLQSSTAWLYDTSQPSMGPIELLNTYTPLQTGVGPGIVLEGEEMCIVDDSVNGATITLRPSNPKAQAVLQQAGVGRGSLGRPELRIEVEQGHSYGWMPAGFEGEADRPVIHRPAMVANVAMWRGVARGGFGYSKRWVERPERCLSHASALFVRCCLQRRPLESYPAQVPRHLPTVQWLALHPRRGTDSGSNLHRATSSPTSSHQHGAGPVDGAFDRLDGRCYLRRRQVQLLQAARARGSREWHAPRVGAGRYLPAARRRLRPHWWRAGHSESEGDCQVAHNHRRARRE